MEVCGGHTHTIYRHGIEHVLPPSVELVHGPGCPVCVIPMGRVDDAISLAKQPGVIFTSFGDMMRVPGSRGNLLQAKAEGADVRFVYSPLDALRLAVDHPDRQVVFFAVGFETTAPSTAITLCQARDRGVTQLQRLLQPRHDRAAHQGHPRIPRPPARRLPRAGPRVDGDRPAALPVRRRAVRQAVGHRRLRAARHPPRRSPCCWPRSARGAARSRTSTSGSCARRGTRGPWPSWRRCSSCGRTSSGGASGSSRRAR